METASAWQQLFEGWPANRPRVGLVVTSGAEPIAFTNFLVSPGILALERERPDTQGARKVLIAFAAITAVKLTDTYDFAEIRKLGFC